MIIGLYTSAAGALIESAKIANATNNLANAGTVGFKKNFVAVRERAPLSELDREFANISALTEKLPGLIIDRGYFDNTQGAINMTGRNLDIAINGKGYFTVSDGKDFYYTRAGNFLTNSDNELVTPDGKYKLIANNYNVVKVTNPGMVSFGSDGAVYEGEEKIAQLRVVDFADPQNELVKVGDNVFKAKDNSKEIEPEFSLVQGALEGSTTNTVDELVNIIQSQRTFESNVEFIMLQSRLLSRLVGQTMVVTA